MTPHSQPTGILLTNLGTPAAPTPDALRRYLGEFLADPRVTEISPWIWWFILHGIILRTRPKRSAQLYQKIWTAQGSPLGVISQAQLAALQKKLATESKVLALGMRYGNPSINEGLEQLRQAKVKQIIVLPLYPQYSSATSGSTFDALSATLKKWRWIPDVYFISDYHAQPAYIQAVVARIRAYWDVHGKPTRLIFSFHGTPKRFFNGGDPYYQQCLETSRLVATQLALPATDWQVTFQSRFGREEWLKPYTDQTLIELGKAGTHRVDVMCPGFAADCLETLEEIDKQNRQLFLNAGGKEFHYIPALNDSAEHIQALADIINSRCVSI